MMTNLPRFSVHMNGDEITHVNFYRLPVYKAVLFITNSGTNWQLTKMNDNGNTWAECNNEYVHDVLIETNSRDFLRAAPIGIYATDPNLEINKRFGIHTSFNQPPIRTSGVRSISIVDRN